MDKYDITEKLLDSPEFVYDIKMEIKNSHNTTGSIDFFPWRLQGIDQYAQLAHELYSIVNPTTKGSYNITLRENSSMEFQMPLGLYKANF